MKQTLSFFQIFDLAFFAPGVILVTVIVYSAYTAGHVVPPGWSLGNAEGLLVLLGGLAAVYVLGLVVHAVVFTLVRRPRRYCRWKKRVDREILAEIERKTDEESPREIGASNRSGMPLALLLHDSSRDGLILYFWYLRATCWNVAAAFVLAAPFPWLLQPGEWQLNLTFLVIALVVAPLLASQGGSYHRAYRKCVLRLPRAPITTPGENHVDHR